MGYVISAFFNILSYEFNYDGFSFSLLDVIYTSLLLTVFGIFIGKIILFALNKR